eukprot:403336067
MSELCLKYGFLLHQHEVTTEDGYILSLFRLEKVAFDRLTTPKLDHKRQIKEEDENLSIEQTLDQQQSKKPKPGKPVLFIHGNNQTPENWLLHGINSPAFILGNEGYDVWLGANRGCKFSNKHTWLQHYTNDSHADDYWRFSCKKWVSMIYLLLQIKLNKKIHTTKKLGISDYHREWDKLTMLSLEDAQQIKQCRNTSEIIQACSLALRLQSNFIMYQVYFQEVSRFQQLNMRQSKMCFLA